MKGFLNFSENTFGKEIGRVPDQAMYGIWCPPSSTDPFSMEIPITPDYGIWPPPAVCK